MSDIRYIHLSTEDRGGVTLAVKKLDPKDEKLPRGFEVGAAFCSPTEHQFNRKLGRLIAEGRLKARRHGYMAYKGLIDRSLLDSPADLILVLSSLRAQPHAEGRGPNWWPKFMWAMRRRFEQRRTRGERADGRTL